MQRQLCIWSMCMAAQCSQSAEALHLSGKRLGVLKRAQVSLVPILLETFVLALWWGSKRVDTLCVCTCVRAWPLSNLHFKKQPVRWNDRPVTCSSVTGNGSPSLPACRNTSQTFISNCIPTIHLTWNNTLAQCRTEFSDSTCTPGEREDTATQSAQHSTANHH